MKKIFYILLFAFLSQQTFCQQLHLMIAKKETANYHPIHGDRAYSVIINSNEDKKELISKTKKFFLAEELAVADDLKTVVYDENVSRYKIRLSFKHGQSKSKGMMGAVIMAPPVILYFDAIFLFNTEGQMKVTFTNFDSDVYTIADEKKYINCYKGNIGKTEKRIMSPILDADKEIENESSIILTTETAVGKALLFINGQRDVLEKINRGDFRKGLNEQFELYQVARLAGSGVIVNKENIKDYLQSGPMAKYWNDLIEKFQSDNLVMAVDNYRWNSYFEPNFNYFFKEISNIVSGEIYKIALDGNVKYENVEGVILPTDKKERKKWLKKGVIF